MQLSAKNNKNFTTISFLLMTLGPSFMSMAEFENVKGCSSDFLVVFGRVPMFAYVVNLYLVHIIAGLLRVYQRHQWDQTHMDSSDQSFEFGLGPVFIYLMWISVVLLMLPVSKWYMNFKKGMKSPIYSYI